MVFAGEYGTNRMLYSRARCRGLLFVVVVVGWALWGLWQSQPPITVGALTRPQDLLKKRAGGPRAFHETQPENHSDRFFLE